MMLELLRAHRVLLLHRYPQYYGQRERQNREHRAWLEGVDGSSLQTALQRMLAALNVVWRRPSLGWQTSAQVWSTRKLLTVDRLALWDDVVARTAKLHEKLGEKSEVEELAKRLAIEQALGDRGLIGRTAGGWCLTTTSALTVIVLGETNQPPTVRAGTYAAVPYPQRDLRLAGTVADDGNPTGSYVVSTCGQEHAVLLLPQRARLTGQSPDAL